MMGGSRQELELREAPHLCPRCSQKDVGVRRAREIWSQISRSMDLWEKGLHMGLVGDTEEEGSDREKRATCGGDEEDEVIARGNHDTVLLGKIR